MLLSLRPVAGSEDGLLNAKVGDASPFRMIQRVTGALLAGVGGGWLAGDRYNSDGNGWCRMSSFHVGMSFCAKAMLQQGQWQSIGTGMENWI